MIIHDPRDDGPPRRRRFDFALWRAKWMVAIGVLAALIAVYSTTCDDRGPGAHDHDPRAATPTGR